MNFHTCHKHASLSLLIKHLYTCLSFRIIIVWLIFWSILSTCTFLYYPEKTMFSDEKKRKTLNPKLQNYMQNYTHIPFFQLGCFVLVPCSDRNLIFFLSINGLSTKWEHQLFMKVPKSNTSIWERAKIKHINLRKGHNYTHQNKTDASWEKSAKISQFRYTPQLFKYA